MALVETFLQDGYKDIVNRWDWNWLRVPDLTLLTTLGQATYNLSEDTGRLRTFYIPTLNRKLIWVSMEWLVENNYTLTSLGMPRYVFVVGYDKDDGATIVQFFPVPDANNIQIVGVVDVKAITLQSSDVIPLPDNLIGVLKDYGRASIYEHLGQIQDAQAYLSKYERGLTSAMGEDDWPIAEDN